MLFSSVLACEREQLYRHPNPAKRKYAPLLDMVQMASLFLGSCDNADYETPEGALEVLRGMLGVNCMWLYVSNLDDESQLKNAASAAIEKETGVRNTFRENLKENSMR